MGLLKNGKRGKLIIMFKILFPHELSDETKQKLNALKDGDKTVDLRTKIEVFEALPTMIDVQVKNLAARFDDLTREELISDIQERMLRINKQGKSPDLTFNGTGQVYGFLNGRIRNRLLSDGFNEQSISSIVDETRSFVASEIEFALAANYPEPAQLYSDLYE